MDITTIGIALTLITVTAFVAVRVKDYLDRKMSIRELQKAGQVFSAMKRVTNRTIADRFLILSLSNGGRQLRVGTNKYISILYEVNTSSVADIMNDYKRFLVDAAYVDIIIQLLNKRVITFNVNELPHGIMRDAFEKDGIQSGILFYIGFRNKRHFFGSITTTSESPMFDTGPYVACQVAINTIQNIFTKQNII